MGNQNVQYVNAKGRSVPAAVATGALRKFILRTAPLILALSAHQDTPKPPTYDPDLYSDQAIDRTRAEQKAIEAAYGDVVLIPVEWADHTFIDDAEHENHPEGVEVNEGNGYYAINVDRMYQTILAGFERTGGQFNTGDKAQRGNLEAYLPNGEIPEDIRLVNSLVARRMTENMIGRFSSDNLGVAWSMRFNRNELDPNGLVTSQQQMTGCVVMLLPPNMDSDEYVRRFTSIKNMQVQREIDLADFNQFIANHEFTHCVFGRRGMATWASESAADIYAAARHIQLNGDDGFVQLMRDVRNVSVISHRDFGHDTVPEGFKQVQAEVEARRALFDQHHGLINVDTHAMRSLDRSRLEKSTLPENTEQLARMEAMLESHNESVSNLYMAADRVRRVRTLPPGRPSAENIREDELFVAMQRRRGVLQELADTQESPQAAYNALGYEVKKLADREANLRQTLGDERAEQILARPDNTGLNFAQQVVILTEFRVRYGNMPGVQPDDLQMPTPAQPAEEQAPAVEQGGRDLVS